MPDDGDEGAGIIHIVNLAQNNNTVLVSDFVKDFDSKTYLFNKYLIVKFLAYDPSQEMFFAFESYKFCYFNLPKINFEGEALVSIDASAVKFRT